MATAPALACRATAATMAIRKYPVLSLARAAAGKASSTFQEQHTHPYPQRLQDQPGLAPQHHQPLRSRRRLPEQCLQVQDHRVHPPRGRAVRQRLLRHRYQDQDCQGPRRLWRRLHRAHLACRQRAVPPRLRGDLQARPQGQDPHSREMQHERRQAGRRNRC
jgi:hypothetical protein